MLLSKHRAIGSSNEKLVSDAWSVYNEDLHNGKTQTVN